MRRHRPVGAVLQTASLLTPTAALFSRVALERQAGLRLKRLASAAGDRLVQGRRPTRPKMRELTVAPGGRFRWREAPVPRLPSPDGALVHPIAAATRDLDRLLGLGRTPFPLPLHFGHECVAEVLSVGERVQMVAPVDRVVVPFQISCGQCAPCRAWHTGNCASVPPVSMYAGLMRRLPLMPLVIDATAIPSGMRAAVEHTAPDGICTSVGTLHRNTTLPAGLMYGRNVTFQIARTHARAVIPHVLGLMSAGKLHPEQVTTDLQKMDDAPQAITRHVLGQATKTILVE